MAPQILPRVLALLILGMTLSAAIASPAFAQDGENVLVLNSANPSSREIAARYMSARHIPEQNVVRLSTVTTDDIERPAFEREIQRPIADWLTSRSAQDRILYIVLVKGLPLRVRGTEGPEGTVASVDSELTLLYRRMLGMSLTVPGHIPNPFFLGDRPLSDAKPFSHRNADIYLVNRLDGFTVADALQLIARGAAPVRDGQVLLDRKANLLGDRSGDAWLAAAADALTAEGFGDRVVLDSSRSVLSGAKQVLGYYSWGSNDPAIRRRRLDLGFLPGSLAATFVSTDGRTFTEPPPSWSIGTWADPKTFYAGSPQSLAGDLIREGATGVAGHVAEPFLDATIRPQILFPSYTRGMNLAESFYLAMPYLSWQTIVVGDPLCAPFRTQGLSQEDSAPGIDPETELPRFFSARNLAILNAAGVAAAAARSLLQAGARTARGDKAGARAALEAATSIDSRLNAAHLLLAGMYEADGDYDKAIVRYRAILATAPNDPISLNNLAFALAVRKGAPGEALPLAQRAYQLTGGQSQIADTLGWIHHLLGHQAEAEVLLAAAGKGAPGNSEIQLHLALVYADLGRRDDAIAALNRAVTLSPAMENRDEVARLRKGLNP